MKKFYTLLLALVAIFATAQQSSTSSSQQMPIPAGYYNSATGTGYTLKTQLYNIVKGHIDRTYPGLYVTYITSDKDFYYENNGTVLDMYSEKPNGPDSYEYIYGVNQDNGTGGNAEGEFYNREHLIPQSVFSSATPMYSDAHFVVPVDKYVNATRGDLPFSKVSTANFTSTNGSKRGSNLNSGYSAGYSGTVFEPIDEFKGDIARCLLYFATRYENVVAGYNFTMFNNTSNQVFTNQAINVLLTWHLQDPVSQREIDRNNAVYTRQQNRNPYIDHPEYATAIWGSLLRTASFSDWTTIVSVYPNPTNDHNIKISSAANLKNIDVVSINGQIIKHIENPLQVGNEYKIDNLPSGFYFLKIGSADGVATKKIIVN